MKKTRYIIILFSAILGVSCGSGNEFMDGAPLRTVSDLAATKMVPKQVSAELADLLQVKFLEEGKLLLGFREAEDRLVLYDAVRDSVEKVLVGRVPDDDTYPFVGSVRVRKDSGKRLVDAFVLPHAVITLDMDRVDSDVKPYVVETRLYDDYFPWSKYETRSPHVDGENLIAVQDFDGRKNVHLVDAGGNIIKAWHVFPNQGFKEDDWESTFYVKPDRTRAVFLMAYMDKVSFLDLVGDDNYTVTTSRVCPSDMRVAKSNSDKYWTEQPAYYRNGCVTDNYVYAIYVPVQRCVDAIGKSIHPYIHVFDWDGNLVKKLSFDESVYSIDVDENSGLLYAITWDDTVVTYSLEI